MEELSEEELLAAELAEEDLLLYEEEEEEWRHYDEEVQQYKDLVSMFGERNGAGGGGGVDDIAEVDLLLDQLRNSAELSALDAEPPRGGAVASSSSSASPSSSSSSRAAQDDAFPKEPEKLGLVAALPGLPALVRSECAALQLQPALDGSMEVEGSVVVNRALGPSTAVVMLSHSPDQPEVLQALTAAMHQQGVRILRGWLEAEGALALDAFEVCNARTGGPLLDEDLEQLQDALVRAVRVPTARRVIEELNGQVPCLECFFGLPAEAPQPELGAEAVRKALVEGPFKVSEVQDFGRAFVLRGTLEDGYSSSEAVRLCQRRLREATSAAAEEQWDCIMAAGYRRPFMVLVPEEDLKQAISTSYDQGIVAVICAFFTAIYAQSAVPASLVVSPPVATLILGTVGAGELARRVAAESSGARLSWPCLLPSSALGTFGAASCAVSLVPSRSAWFDMAAAASTTSLMVSVVLIVVGLFNPVTEMNCAWVSPSVLPYMLRNLILLQAESSWDVCMEPPMDYESGALPAPTTLIAGCFGAVIAALNTLPLAGLDGTAIAAAAPWSRARDTVLPWAAFLLLASTFFDSGNGLFPLVLGFAFFTFAVRPRLVPEPQYRDNIAQPQDFQRRGTAFLLFLLAFSLLMPSWLATT